MNLAEIIASSGGSVLLLLTLIQIAPIKVNPWSAIARALGKALNAELLERMDTMESDIRATQSDVHTLQATVDKNKAVDCRARIVHFGDEIQHNVRHSQEHFNAIMYDITVYEAYCRDNPDFPNEVAIMTIDLIRKTYRKCLETDSFL